MIYAFTENYVLPLSHDEVVHGKGSLIGKMPGDDWQQFANLRLLYAYQWAMSGKKLLFMGGEIAQRSEWKHDGQLPWEDLEHESHRGLQQAVTDLNALYKTERALHELDCEPEGFEWIDASDAANSVLCFVRKATGPERILCVLNFTPVVRQQYRVGVPGPGYWREIFNSDSEIYWGSNVGNDGGVHAEFKAWHGQPYSVVLTLPPLAALFLKGSL
jgi:1,4-alpha-glucan branching enzyme